MTVGSPPPTSWLATEARRLLTFPQGPRPPRGGSYWLDDDGSPRLDLPLQTWITSRMTYVYALAMLEDVPGAAEAARWALNGLVGPLRDDRHGGWVDEAPDPPDVKSAYTHAFVVLAAATASIAGVHGARPVLDEALEIIEQKFWDEDSGLAVDTWSRDWVHLSPYRGLNANMHLVEAYLAASSLDRPDLYDRALGICRRVATWAAAHNYRIPEHFTASWEPLPDYNVEHPHDPFKPFGSVPGHGFEWARLMLHVATRASAEDGRSLTATAVRLYERAREDGWARNGKPGFVYTVDWAGNPVVEQRLAWVAAEAVAAAATLGMSTVAADVEADLAVWWDYIRANFVDETRGSWLHELDPANRAASTIWHGRPDLYHAYQACTLPRFPLASSLAAAVSGRAPRRPDQLAHAQPAEVIVHEPGLGV